MQKNVPMSLTICIGRKQEIETACELLERDEVRLLTLSGIGGVGKTRLALEVARHMERFFHDGFACIFLEALRKPYEVLPALCQQLAIHITDQQECSKTLERALQEKHMLLFLDNFEQIVDAAPRLTELLVACPYLKLLVTSRVSLHVRGEYELIISPLALPDEHTDYTLQSLSQVAAVQLFVQQVRTFQPDFFLDVTNARSIVEICKRLDGLPLAIELAAARLRLFSPQILLQRLERCLPLLTNGAQDYPLRQRTLRNTLAWSYDLLDYEEQRFFRRLAVFRGGFTFEMVELVCGAGEATTDLLTSLLHNNLLQRREGDEEPRLLLLETVCEFASELLADDPAEKERVARAHVVCYLSLAETAELELEGVQRDQWQQRLERERANLTAAWSWLVKQHEVELTLRLSGALRRFWTASGTWRCESEYQDLQYMLQESKDSEDVSTQIRAKALLTAGMLAYYHHTYDLSVAYCEESLQLCLERGEHKIAAAALNQLGRLARIQGRRTEALKLLHEGLAFSREVADQQGSAEALLLLADVYSSKFQQDEALFLAKESLSLFKAIQDKRGYASALKLLAYIAEEQEDQERARMLADESLELYRAIGDTWESGNALLEVAYFALIRRDYELAYQQAEEGLSLTQQTQNREACAWALCLMGHAQLYQGEKALALELLHESLVSYRALGNSKGSALLLQTLARLALERGDYSTARASAEECLTVFIARDSLRAIPTSLELLGKIALAQGDYRQATLLLAAATTALERARRPQGKYHKTPYLQERDAIQAMLGTRAFQAYWEEGCAMVLQQAFTMNTPCERPKEAEGTGHTQRAAQLTAREREILSHLSRGLTNPQIARQLTISPVTVNAHVRSIYNKLAVNSRSEATRYALEHHLA